MASASSEAEPERMPAPISTANMAALTISATHRMRRYRGSALAGLLWQWSSWQWADMGFSGIGCGMVDDWKP
jgi:hypothetical protein